MIRMFAPLPPSSTPNMPDVVPSEVIDELNEKSQIFLANSVDLFHIAWAGYLSAGRGLILVGYDSVQHMRRCVTVKQFNTKYTEMTDMLSFQYAPANELMKTYDPDTSFVLMISIKYMQGFVFAATQIARNAQYKLQEGARKAAEAMVAELCTNASPGAELRPPPSLRDRLCCAVRSAVGLEPCSHVE